MQESVKYSVSSKNSRTFFYIIAFVPFLIAFLENHRVKNLDRDTMIGLAILITVTIFFEYDFFAYYCELSFDNQMIYLNGPFRKEVISYDTVLALSIKKGTSFSTSRGDAQAWTLKLAGHSGKPHKRLFYVPMACNKEMGAFISYLGFLSPKAQIST